MRGIRALTGKLKQLGNEADSAEKKLRGMRRASLDLISDKQSKRIEDYIDESASGPYLKAYIVAVIDNPDAPYLTQTEQFLRDWGVKVDFMAIRRVAREAKRLGLKAGQKNAQRVGGALAEDFDKLADLGGI